MTNMKYGVDLDETVDTVVGPKSKYNKIGILLIYCPKCGSPPNEHEVRNYDLIWGDGDIHCCICGTYVRGYDRG